MIHDFKDTLASISFKNHEIVSHHKSYHITLSALIKGIKLFEVEMYDHETTKNDSFFT